MAKKKVVPLDKTETIKKKRNHTPKVRSDTEKQRDAELLNRIMTNGKRILPTDAKKYNGTISNDGKSSNWSTGFPKKYSIKGRIHKTKEEAIERLKRVCLRRGLEIKNMIYLYEGQYYCVLSQGQVMKFSEESIDLVNSHTWFAHYNNYTNSYYAETNVHVDAKKRMTDRFNRMLFPDIVKKDSVDHINRDSLDNNLSNVRKTTMVIQNMNKGLRLDNKSGETGVIFCKSRNVWQAEWRETLPSGERKRFKEYFSISKYGYDGAKERASKRRREKIATLPDYKLALGI